MKSKKLVVKNWLVIFFLSTGLSVVDKAPLSATSSMTGVDSSDSDDPYSVYRQAGLIFGAAFASAFTAKIMPWIGEQLKNGNARKFFVSLLTFWRKPKPHPVLTMFPSLASDLSKELEFIVRELDKVSTPIFHAQSNTMTYAIGNHAYFFRLPGVGELETAYDMNKVTATYLNGGALALQDKESVLTSTIFKVIDTLGEAGATNDILKFRQHLADAYREWLSKGRVYPLLVSRECISLLFDMNQLEFGFMKTSVDNADISIVIASVDDSIATRKILKSRSIQEQMGVEEVRSILGRLTHVSHSDIEGSGLMAGK